MITSISSINQVQNSMTSYVGVKNRKQQERQTVALSTWESENDRGYTRPVEVDQVKTSKEAYDKLLSIENVEEASLTQEII